MAARKVQFPIPSADDLVAKNDIDEATIDVEEWGYSIRVRELTRGEARKIGESGMTAEESEIFVLTHAVLEPRLSDEQARSLVNDKSFTATEKVLDKILELSGMIAGFRS